MNAAALDQRMQIVTSLEWLRRVDAWRRQQEEIPNRSEAVRRLVEIGLDAAGAKQSPA